MQTGPQINVQIYAQILANNYTLGPQQFRLLRAAVFWVHNANPPLAIYNPLPGYVGIILIVIFVFQRTQRITNRAGSIWRPEHGSYPAVTGNLACWNLAHNGIHLFIEIWTAHIDKTKPLNSK